MSAESDQVRIAAEVMVSIYALQPVPSGKALSAFAIAMKIVRGDRERLFAVLLLFVHYCVVQRLDWAQASSLLAWEQNHGISLENYPLVLFTTYEIILKIFDSGSETHGGLKIDWLERVQNPTEVLDLGLCPQLLFYIGRITELTLQHPLNPEDRDCVLWKIERLQQEVSGATGEAEMVARQIAETYRLSAQLLAHVRLFG